MNALDWLGMITSAIQDLSRSMQHGESGDFDCGYAYGLIFAAMKCGYLDDAGHQCFSNMIDTIYHREK